LIFARKGDGGEHLIVAINATPAVLQGYRIGALSAGTYREALNTDSEFYGGGNVGNYGALETQPIPSHGYPQSLVLTLPPLAALVLEPISGETAP